jgi:serine/threonine protein kinase/tetratricopeptide (TPR) repeat protein
MAHAMDTASDQSAQELTGQPPAQKLRHAVFISHSSEDKLVAEAIRAQLESSGIGCWIAPRDVMAGRPYSGQITEAIRSAQVLILILSRQSNRSKQVLREVERGAHCQIRLLTFRIEQVEPNDDLAYFVGVEHRLDALPGPPDTYYSALLRQTIALLQTKPEPSEETESAQPETYGNFRVLRRPDGSLYRLGKGGMGVTWKAIDAHLDRPVALKVIGADLLSSVQARNRFLREAQAAAKIHHPHVATVHQFGQEGDAYFYAMEYVEGEDLEKYVARQGPLSPANALRVVLQVAQALEAAQAHNLIHRDIKPANLMATINRAGNLEIKLIDFGLAKGAGAKNLDLARITRSQDFVGSPAFASPEQCEMGELDTRSDIYSLGVTLWYLLAGKRPFAGTVGQVLIAHAVKPPPFDQLTGVPEPVLNLLRKMLAKDPSERPQNPQQLQTEVEIAAAQLAAEFGCVPDRNPSPTVPVREALDMESAPEPMPTIASPLFDPYLNAFATGNLVADRYRLGDEEREGTGGRFFVAQDEKAASGQPAQVGLKLLHPGIVDDSSLLDLLENELGVIGKSPHPHLLRYIGLERHLENPFIIREWVHGFLLFDLLRWRGSLQAAELGLLLESLGATLDFVSGQGFGLVEVSVRKILVACPEDLHPDHFPEYVRRDARDWKTCTLKLNPLSIAPLLYRHRTNRPQQTLVPTSQVMSLTQAEAGIQGTKAVRLFGQLIYELLSGHAIVRQPGKYTPLPALNEPGNITLREACVVTGQNVTFRNCQEFWNALRPNLSSAQRSVAQTVPVTDQSTQKRSHVETPPAAGYKPPLIGHQPPPKLVPPPLPISAASGPQVKRNLLPIAAALAGGAIVLSLVIGGMISFFSWSWSQIVAAKPTPTTSVAITSPTVTPSIAIATPTPVVGPTVSPSPSVVTNGQLAKTAFDRAYAEAEKNDYQSAIRDYTEAIRLDPDDSSAHNNRGNAYRELQQYDNALNDYNEALRLKPDNAFAHNGRGNVYEDTGQYDKAISDYAEAIRLKPDYALAYNGRGIAYDDLKQYDRAVNDYTEAIRLEPEYADAYNNRGNAYRDLKQYDRAISDYTVAIRLKPDYAFAYNGRGNAYEDSGHYDKAISDYTEAIRLKPDYAFAYNGRGIAYDDLKQYDRAISDYSEAIRLRSTYADAYNNRGWAYHGLRQYDRAISDFTEAIRLRPDYALAYSNRAISYEALGDAPKAEQDRRRAKQLRGNQ